VLSKLGEPTTTLIVFFSFACLMAPVNGYNFPILLIFLSPLILWRMNFGNINWLGDNAKLVYLFLSIFLLSALAIYLRGERLALFDKALRYAVMLIGFLVLLRFQPKAVWVYIGIGLGATYAGYFAIAEKLATNTARVGEHINPIQFGSFSMLLSLLALILANHYLIKALKNKKLISAACAGLFFVGSGLALWGALLSGSRGGWLSAPLFLLVVYKQYHDAFGLAYKAKLVLLGLFAAVLFGAYASPKLTVASRVQEAKQQVVAYYKDGIIDTSVGARLEMWRVAIRLGLEKPLLGWGHAAYNARVTQLAKEKKTSGFLENFNEPHNQFLDAFAKNGIVGLILVLILYFWPARIFYRRYSSETDWDSRKKLHALLGFVSMLAFVDFSLTHSFINKNGGLMLFLFCISLFWVMSTQQDETTTATPNADARSKLT
jgi:O-antigen ligase